MKIPDFHGEIAVFMAWYPVCLVVSVQF